LKLIEKKGWTYVFAMARNRKYTNGKYVSDLMRYLPKSAYRRRALYKPDGRRVITRSLKNGPRFTILVMSQRYDRKNGVTQGRIK